LHVYEVLGSGIWWQVLDVGITDLQLNLLGPYLRGAGARQLELKKSFATPIGSAAQTLNYVEKGGMT
jgi:hypothetical protein